MHSTYLTWGQAARRLGISSRSLLRAVQRGALRPAHHSRGGSVRFRMADVDAYARRLGGRPHRGPARRLRRARRSGPRSTGDEHSYAPYQQIADLTSDYAYRFTIAPDGTRLMSWVSDAYEQVTGYTLNDMQSPSVQASLIHPEDIPVVLERIQSLLAGRTAIHEYRIITKSGAVRWVRDHAQPVRDGTQGRVVRIDGVAQDITHAKQAQERIRFQARLLDSVEQAVIASDLHGRVTYWNRYAEVMYGWSAGEMIGRSLDMIVPPPSSEQAATIMERLQRGESWSGEFVVRRRDGSTFPAWVTDSPIADDRGTLIGMVVVSVDITARKQVEAEAERARRAAEELARVRQEQADEARAMAAVSAALGSALDVGAVYALILEEVARVLPYDHAAILLHEDGWVVVAGSRGRVTVPTGARAFRLSDIDDVASHGMAGTPALIRDTHTVPGWIAVPPFVDDCVIRSVIVVPLLVEGRVAGTFNVDSFTPNFYTDRHLAVAITFAERVTQALRNARLYTLEQERARAAEELARMRSDFVAAVSHELRTPLTAIIGYAELLQERWAGLSEARRLRQIGIIVQAANRQRRLVEDLLLIGQVDLGRLTPSSAPIDLAPLVDQAIAEVRAAYPGQPITVVGQRHRRILADQGRILQVLVNLLDNAAKYSPEGSPIDVACTHEGEMVAVRVRDHGPGIPEAGREHLFTQFGRLAGSRIRAGRVGTGLGLYLSRTLVEAMGGDLDLEETGPRGSTFRLRLPSAAGPAAHEPT